MDAEAAKCGGGEGGGGDGGGGEVGWGDEFVWMIWVRDDGFRGRGDYELWLLLGKLSLFE